MFRAGRTLLNLSVPSLNAEYASGDGDAFESIPNLVAECLLDSCDAFEFESS